MKDASNLEYNSHVEFLKFLSACVLALYTYLKIDVCLLLSKSHYFYYVRGIGNIKYNCHVEFLRFISACLPLALYTYRLVDI